MIYTRYSSNKQRDTSLDDQERVARRHLDTLGIPHHDAVVLRDSAQKGSRQDRPEYVRLTEMMERRQIAILIVHDQSRLGRNYWVVPFIQDLIHSGGRFIAVADGIDTVKDPRGWEVHVALKQVMNKSYLDALADGCRKGLEGRVLAENGSAGDFPMGYRSEFIDPNWQDKMYMKDVRLKKRIVIDPPTADVVRSIYQMYAWAGMTINGIVRHLNRIKASKGKKARSATWFPAYVSQILENEKYTGKWEWGVTKAIRDSKGEKERRETRPKVDQVCVERPDLRIIDDETWSRAQERRQREKQIWSRRHLAVRTGEYVHPRHMHPEHNLGGLVRCAHCGKPVGTVWQRNKNKFRMFYCRNHADGACPGGRRVQVQCVEETLMSFLRSFAEQSQGWADEVAKQAKQIIDERLTDVPGNLAAFQRQHNEVCKKIARLIRQLEEFDEVEELAARLTELKAERKRLEYEIDELQQVVDATPDAPTAAQIRKRMEELPNLATTHSAANADLLRQLFRDIELVQTDPGKREAPFLLRLRPRHQELLEYAIDSAVCRAVGASEMIVDDPLFKEQFGEVIELAVIERHRAYYWGPIFERWRNEDPPLSWKDIGERVNKTASAACGIYKRWKKAQ